MKFIVLALAFGISTANAGDGSTSVEDGGHGVLCKRFSNGVLEAGKPFILSLELLDFYEGRSLDDSIDVTKKEKVLDFLDSPSRKKRLCWDLARRQKQLKRVIGEHPIFRSFHDACRLSHSMEFQSRVPTTHDHGAPLVKLRNRCELVQIGFRTVVSGVEKILVDEDYAYSLSYEELAGLALHESLHKYFESKTSTKAIRQIVFYSFASLEFQKRNKDVLLGVIQTGRPALVHEFR